MTIAFVTEPAKPEIVPDDQLTADLVTRAGHSVQGVPWTANVDWTSFDLVVIRSPWDYHYRHREFRVWLVHMEKIRANLHNPSQVLQWNYHKGYLLELAAKGIQIVPTTLLARGTKPSLSELIAAHPRSVLKPAIAAGARDTWVVMRDTAAADQPRLHALLTHTDVLLQPYLPEIATDGEWSLLFFNHTFSHAVLKRPKPADFRVQEKHGGSTEALIPPPALIDQAHKILTTASPTPLLYARVDGVVLNNTFTLMELEILEPALFLSTHPSAPQNFATAILSRLPR